jgi:elongation factor 1-beta
MGQAIVTLKLMPTSPDVDLEKMHEDAMVKITAFAGEGDTRKEIEPIAFGLKALKITFVLDEEKGGTDDLETDLNTVEGVQSVEVADVRRALG